MTKEEFRAHYRLARIEFRNLLKKHPLCATPYHAHSIARIDYLNKYFGKPTSAHFNAAECLLNRDRFEFNYPARSGVTTTKQTNAIRLFRVLSLSAKGLFHGTFPKN